ncbi:threonylcarbamoyl-AMP synthase [Candidatus Berkelbacteria bacterium]|nr:threonylcarbamoyl-AMP synthase [Candidatus Berkelbacteria bacterium]
MEHLKISFTNPEPDVIVRAVQVLRQGGCIVYPTDTCYGLGCDARSVRAMKRITQLKGREEAKKFSVIARDIDHIISLTIVDRLQQSILEQYLPGPYTFILLNADFSVAQTSTLGVRIPDCPVTQAIADEFSEAYITTSANLGGTGALYSFEEIQSSLLAGTRASLQPDLILDAGPLVRSPSSTVVDLTKSEPVIIRQGAGAFRGLR